MSKKLAVIVKLQSDYSRVPRVSGSVIDYPTDEKIELELDGKLYTRTVHVRGIYRNMSPIKPLYEFVIIEGVRYAVKRYMWDVATELDYLV